MARFNEILVGRYNRLLQKLLDMKGPPPAPQLASEVVPGFALFNGVENRFLEEWTRYGIVISQAAAAGNFSTCRIAMPVGSNVIAVIESIELAVGTNDSVNEFYANLSTGLDLLTQVFASNLYSGRKAAATPGTLLTGSAAHTTKNTVVGQLANATRQVAILATQSRELINDENQELTLTPGEVWSWQANTVNNTLVVGLKWRERFLEASERF